MKFRELFSIVLIIIFSFVSYNIGHSTGYTTGYHQGQTDANNSASVQHLRMPNCPEGFEQMYSEAGFPAGQTGVTYCSPIPTPIP